MNNLTTIKKQCIAGLLAAFLLVITGVKFFHTCEEVEIEVSSQVDQLSKNTSCAICEFHLNQDVDLTIDHPAINAPLFHADRPNTNFTTHFTSSIGLHFSDRGPPALL